MGILLLIRFYYPTWPLTFLSLVHPPGEDNGASFLLIARLYCAKSNGDTITTGVSRCYVIEEATKREEAAKLPLEFLSASKTPQISPRSFYEQKSGFLTLPL